MAQNGTQEATLADVFADFDALHEKHLLYSPTLTLIDLATKYQATITEMRELFALWVDKRQHGE